MILEKAQVVADFVSGNINADQAAKELIDLVPVFEVRIIIIISLVAILFLVNGLALLIKKRKKKISLTGDNGKKSETKKWSFNFLSSKNKKEADVKNPKQKSKVSRFFSKLTAPFKKVFSKLRKKRDAGKKSVIVDDKAETASEGNNKKAKSPFILFRIIFSIGRFIKRKALVIFNLFTLNLLVIAIAFTFFVRPILIRSNPVNGSDMSDGDEKITVEFDIPFNTKDIKFHVSPDIDGEWKYEKIVDWLPYSRRATFHPKQSFFPDNEVVIYIVGLRSIYSGGKKHEQALEFRSPRIPDIEKITPQDGAENVATNADVQVEFNAPVGKFIDIQYQIDPPIEFKVKSSGDGQEIVFEKDLLQDQKYSLEVFRTPRSYDVKNGEDIERGDTEKIAELSFNTVTTPLIESYEPQGNNILVDSSIKIVFDQPMNPESIVEHFSITPEVKGEIEWEDEKTLLLKPTEQLSKETEYRIVISKGALSKYEGKTGEDVEIKFTTIGKVVVAATSPFAGASGLDPRTTNIVIEFNQEVDKASAQGRFAISPAVAGNFGWEGNKLIYYTAGKLNYSSTYTVSLAPGVKSIHGLDSDSAFSFAFTTRANVVALAVPWYRQQESFSCNLAAARMALAYRGVYVSEGQIKAAIGVGGNPNANWVEGYGVHWGPIASYIGQYRGVAIKSGWNTAELAAEVERGNPVIVWWYNRYSQPAGAFTLPSGATGYMGMHSEVVRGFVGSSDNPTSLMTNDPWRGQLTYNRALFDSTWGYLGYTAVVVY